MVSWTYLDNAAHFCVGSEFESGSLEVKMLWNAQAAAGVAPAYDLDDLDDEWKALLNELEDRLYQVHSPAFPNNIYLICCPHINYKMKFCVHDAFCVMGNSR